ncbi:MAG: N,N-dimethylformamidase beta subunit family domain-containing protein [Actinomycetota bacterium]
MIEGYCWPQSGTAGERIGLAASGDGPTFDVEVLRVGASEEHVARFEAVAIGRQPIPDNPVDVAEQGCDWDVVLEITIDPAWTTGFYLVRMSDGNGPVSEAFFVVRASVPGSTLLVLSTATYAAYNDWGGPSFYVGGHRSSQLRPLPRGFLDKPRPEYFRLARMIDLPRDERRAHYAEYSPWSGAAGFSNQERLFVAWAEREGIELDYATSHDLHVIPGLLEPYTLYVSVGHDEYWSAAMRDAVEDWVTEGGHAAFFSGNTAFWQIRYEELADHQVVGYKLEFEDDPVFGTEAEATLSTMWSDPLVGRPENEMTGVSFTRGGYAHMRAAPRGSGGYTVWRPEHPLFEELDLYVGDLLGAEPIVVGYECDGCAIQLVDGRPVPTGVDGTPTDMTILGTAPAHLWLTEEGAPGLPDSFVGELNWVAQRLGGADTPENRERFAYGNAVMATFDRGAGTVFTSGCTDWAYGLGDAAIAQVTKNVVRRALG